MERSENSSSAKNTKDDFGSEDWDPMQDDYESKFFNTYKDPMKDMERGIAVNPHEKLSPLRDRHISPTKIDSDVVTLFVGNIPGYLTKEGLSTLFERAGNVVNARVIRSRNGPSDRQFGFVEFRTAREAEDAIRQLHGWQLVDGITLTVKLSNTSDNNTHNQGNNYNQSSRVQSPHFNNQPEKSQPRSVSPSPVSQTHPAIVSNSPQPSEKGSCSYCGETGRLKRCGSCKKQYCGVACQRKDWPQHRNECTYKPKPKPSEENNPQITKPVVNGHVGNHIDTDDFENRFEIQIDDAEAGMNDIFGINIKDCVVETVAQNSKIEELPSITESNDAVSQTSHSTSVKALIGNVCSSGLFYANVIKDDDSTALLLEITTKLSTDGRKQKLNSLSRFDCRVGCKVATEYEGEWSRAEIVSVNDQQRNEAEILYIDYGNMEMRPLADLFILPEYAAKLKPQAEKFMLSDFPNASTAPEKEALLNIANEVLLGQLLCLETTPGANGKGRVSLLTDDGEDCSSIINRKYKNADIKQEAEILEVETKPQPPKATSQTKDTPIYVSKLSSKVPLENLPKGAKEITVVLLHVVSPQLIQFQVVSGQGENVMETTQLMNQMREAYDHTTNDDFRPSPGELCVGLFEEDQSWYRASLLSYSDDSQDTAHVRYVDYGNTAHIPVSNLRPIEERFTKLARQARPCCLVREPTSAAITEQCVNFLNGHSLSEIHKVQIVDDRFGKIRFKFADARMRSIIENILSGQGDAIEVDEKLSDLNLNSSPPAPAEKQPSQNPLVSETSQSEQAPMKVPDANKISQSTPIVQDVIANPKIPSPSFPSDQFSALVTHVDSPSNVYGQFAEKSIIQLWMDLSQTLCTKAETNTLSPNAELKNGDFYAAICSDGEWYRAQLISQAQSSVTVRYVDFGNTETVPRSDLRRLDPVDARVSALALPMCLASICPSTGGKWSEDACNRLSSLAVNNVCEVKIVSNSNDANEPAQVELRLRKGSETTIADELIKSGFATAKANQDSQKSIAPVSDNMSCKTFLERSNINLTPGTTVTLRIGGEINPQLFHCKLANTPSKAFPCSLHGVKPNTSDGKWPSEVRDIFTKSTVTENGQINAVVIAVTDKCVMLSPLLIDNPSDRISDVFVRNGHAQYII